MTGYPPKPAHLDSQYAAQFSDKSVVAAYRFRPPYPPQTFDMLSRLITAIPRHVLDAGCGTGSIARPFAEMVDSIDAIDISPAMIEMGKRLPGGDNPKINWITAGMEEAPLRAPYSLIVAGASLHWMDWYAVLPRFSHSLAPGAYLAIVDQIEQASGWSVELGDAIRRYSTNREYRPYNLVEELERRGLFERAGEESTAWQPFSQPLREYIESIHSRNGFSRERMSPEAAAAFDEEVRRIVEPFAKNDTLQLQINGKTTWGYPLSAG